ncbi:ABC transporter permease [Rhodococcus sp. BP-252]|uniref:Antibiotic transporter n=1 Tax=Rhodococcoides kyotonense TaxID=398843 RepID=A0A177Y6C3_9NOCA|nr:MULTISPECIES: ABC transporter permease [Rhodococcus]MBY6410490.1 ABC transporter permease [Rhodococcus sp. BP-320]MBY6417785.1 ABC transporter permease [Rhodococcus sp. BP-321]MBY6420367.1 ABC transporter permease [Rhodococcus sp. BP-324]MBY6425046.1 ABC transporter permease [Rhodococcus sp. BP-323]MBY6430248.1 ABC transporter permease [Rhodococcus sp. BP-322]
MTTAERDSRSSESEAGDDRSRRRRFEPSGFVQWRVLTARTVRTMVKKGELLVAVIAPLIFTIGFYLPLKFVMQFQGIDYAQFLMPIIVLQAMAFTAISSAQRASTEALTGLSTRLKTMPVVIGAPLMARMTSAFLRSTVTLTAALIYGHVIGFRFSAGPLQAMMFGATALAISTVLSFGADAIGTLSKSPEATSQALTLPQLILGMASTGFVPETGFPEWIRPFVRNQPISQFSAAMRDMAEGAITFSVILPALLWIIGLSVVLIPLALWASLRRRE